MKGWKGNLALSSVIFVVVFLEVGLWLLGVSKAPLVGLVSPCALSLNRGTGSSLIYGCGPFFGSGDADETLVRLGFNILAIKEAHRFLRWRIEHSQQDKSPHLKFQPWRRSKRSLIQVLEKLGLNTI